MQMTKIQKIGLSIIAVAILVGGYIVFDQIKKKQIQPGGVTNISTTTNNGGVVVTSNSGSYKVEQVPINEGRGVPQPIPDLNRAVYQSSSAKVSADMIAAATTQIVSLQTTLKKNPADFNSWLNLGIYQKMAGDYQGSVISWQYASKLAPTDYISLGNLGNIYAYFIHDNAKAETYYLQAIKNGPQQEYLYTQLAEVYRDIFHDNTKALNIINKGLTMLPDNVNLLQMKASLSSS